MAMGVGVGFTSEMEQVKRQMTQAMWNATPRGGDRPQPRYALGGGQSAQGNAGVGDVYLDRRKVGQIVFRQQGQDAGPREFIQSWGESMQAKLTINGVDFAKWCKGGRDHPERHRPAGAQRGGPGRYRVPRGDP